MWSRCGAISIMSTAISISMSPLVRVTPSRSVSRLAGLVTTEKPL